MFVFRAAIYGFQHISEISRNPTKNPMELNRKIGVASYWRHLVIQRNMTRSVVLLKSYIWEIHPIHSRLKKWSPAPDIDHRPSGFSKKYGPMIPPVQNAH